MKSVDIRNFTTMKIGGKVSFVKRIERIQDILEFIDTYENHSKTYTVIGGGSNVFFGENLTDLSIAKMEIPGIDIVEENNNSVVIKVGAGENWQGVVDFAVNKNFSGIESLSGIPGTMGAAPVQNIGAYGNEIKNYLEFVEVYDTKRKEFAILKNRDCEFEYRNSIFKKNQGRWIITSVAIRLLKNGKIKIPKYKDTEKYFESWDSKNIKLQDIRDAINKIRSNKLPNPKIIPNCGSFFKNPIIEKSLANKIVRKFTDMPTFLDGRRTKIPAGYLIEKAGFKGKRFGNIEIYKNNALVLTNPEGKASFQEITNVKNIIEREIYKLFGIRLETEVNIIS